ncbi:MAG: penicillin acylase family protein [Acidobacteriota bacterium]|nr:penicillin acylase family protein [Acidobacteriota bacterium]
MLDQRSAAAALYVAWERRLLENYWNRRIPEQARPFFRSRPLQRMIEALYAPDGTFGPDPIRGREELLVESLAQAVRDVTERLGADWRAWTYGHVRFKRVLFRHPLGQAVALALSRDVGCGPGPTRRFRPHGEYDRKRRRADLRRHVSIARGHG